MTSKTQTIDPNEINKFKAIADQWWNEQGDFRPLHMLNPIRIQFIRDHLCQHFERDPLSPYPLKGLDICDVGSGGGLVCEPLCRLGAEVTGIDATHQSVEIARIHARDSGLDIHYLHGTAEDLVAKGHQFDAVISMEVIEHVADLQSFLSDISNLTKPGGCLALSTFNRTIKAGLFGILGAEYIMRWLPRGTHDWKKFVRPNELASGFRSHGVDIKRLSGMVYNPLLGDFSLSRRDLDINYLAFATKQLQAA